MPTYEGDTDTHIYPSLQTIYACTITAGCMTNRWKRWRNSQLFTSHTTMQLVSTACTRSVHAQWTDRPGKGKSKLAVCFLCFLPAGLVYGKLRFNLAQKFLLYGISDHLIALKRISTSPLKRSYNPTWVDMETSVLYYFISDRNYNKRLVIATPRFPIKTKISDNGLSLREEGLREESQLGNLAT